MSDDGAPLADPAVVAALLAAHRAAHPRQRARLTAEQRADELGARDVPTGEYL